jgi:ribosomal protein L31E
MAKAKTIKAQPVKPRSGSVVYWLRERLKRKSYVDDCITVADEIAKVVVEKACQGEFNFINLIVQKVESNDLTREEALVQVEQFYNTCRRHVKDQPTLAKIAQDLSQYKDRLDGSFSNG